MPKLHRAVVVLGGLQPRALTAVREAASAVAAVVVPHEGAAEACLDRAPLAMLVPMKGARAFERCEQVRSDRRFASIPLIVVGDCRNTLSFGELFQSGGDDIVAPGDAASLARRLRAICTLASPRPRDVAMPGGSEPYAVVAGPPSKWQAVVGRALLNAGVPTRFVETAAEAIAASRGARAVVAADGLGPAGAHVALAEARAAGSETPWVIVAEPRRVPEIVAAVQSLTRVAVVDSFAPPENALFAANELAATSSVTDHRAAPRLLYGASVGFRVAGHEDDDVGFTYNVSEGGLFVRTLAPPASGEDVWLELWAPRTSRRVRLSGKVAWRRHFGPSESATVPPGFGVRVTEGLAGDLERWRDGCALLQRDELRVRPRVSPKTHPSTVPSVLSGDMA